MLPRLARRWSSMSTAASDRLFNFMAKKICLLLEMNNRDKCTVLMTRSQIHEASQGKLKGQLTPIFTTYLLYVPQYKYFVWVAVFELYLLLPGAAAPNLPPSAIPSPDML